MKSLFSLTALSLAGLFAAAQAAAATLVITGDTADRTTYTGPGWPDGDAAELIRVGIGGEAPHLERAAVFVFRLPDNLATRDVTDAAFSVGLVSTIHASAMWSFNADLYAFGARTSPKVEPEDHFAGRQDHRRHVSLIQKRFASPDMIAPLDLSTNDEGNKQLAAFVRAQLEKGGAGKWIFLRLNPDVSPEAGGFNFASADNQGRKLLRPTLVITTGRP